jgi:hypothetical protein
MLIIGVLFAFLAVGLSAQTSKGTIAGTITDPSGAVVVGATVTAKDAVGGETRTATTGNNGEFRIEAISPSKYDVTIASQGFATSKVTGLEVRASVITPLNQQLKTSGTSDTIEVSASTESINTESAELSNSVSALEVQQLPIASVNPIELALTEPGVVRVSSRDSFTNGVGFFRRRTAPSRKQLPYRRFRQQRQRHRRPGNSAAEPRSHQRSCSSDELLLG